MRKLLLLVLLLLVGGAVKAEKLDALDAYDLAVDDVYKLTQNSKKKYTNYQAEVAALHVDELHAKLKGFRAQDMHQINDNRLRAATKNYRESRQKVAQVNHERLMKVDDEKELSNNFALPLLRYAYYSNMHDQVLPRLAMSVGCFFAVTMAYAGSTQAERVGGALMGAVIAIGGFVGSFTSYAEHYKYCAVMYHLEKRDHARRAELINRLCKK